MRADAAERRSRLLDAGRDLFADVGYDVPLEAIADRAGVGIATLYRNFASRQDLKIALLADGLAKSRATLDVLLDMVESEPIAAISRLGRMFVSLRLGALIAIIVRDLESIPRELIEARAANLESVAEILRRSEPSVRWLIATKRIKTGKLGGRIVVKPEDLDAFIEAGFSDQA